MKAVLEKCNLKQPGFNILVLERKARSATERSGVARRAWSGRTKIFREPGHRGGFPFYAAFFNLAAITQLFTPSHSCTWCGV